MGTWCNGAEPSGRDPRSTSAIPTATGSSSSRADELQHGAEKLLGRHRAALRRRLEEARLGDAEDHRGDRRRVEVAAKVTGGHAGGEDVLEGQPDLLPLPGQRHPELLVVPSPEPAGEKRRRVVRVALAVGAEQDLHRALELPAGRLLSLRDAGQLDHDGQPALLEQRRGRRSLGPAAPAPPPGEGRAGGRRQLPLSTTNSYDSICTRYRFSLPLEFRRISNVELPREGMLPATCPRARLTTRPFSSRPSAIRTTWRADAFVVLRMSPK